MLMSSVVGHGYIRAVYNDLLNACRVPTITRFKYTSKRVASGFHTRPKKITQKITSGALLDATRFDVYLNRANVGNAAPAFHGNLM